MRFIVLLIGLVAVFLTAVTGVGMIFFNVAADGIKPFLAEVKIEVPAWAYESVTGQSHGNTGLLLLLAAAYGFLGVLLSGFLRCGKQGAILLIFPLLITTFMNPLTAVFTSVQAFAGLLSFFVFPLPIDAPKADAAAVDNEGD